MYVCIYNYTIAIIQPKPDNAVNSKKTIKIVTGFRIISEILLDILARLLVTSAVLDGCSKPEFYLLFIVFNFVVFVCVLIFTSC